MKRLVGIILTVSLLCFSAACGGGGGGSDSSSSPSQVLFTARLGGQVAACGQEVSSVGAGNSTVRIKDLRFYISNLALLRSDGVEVPVSMIDDGLFQQNNLALLDFEDATSDCSEIGTSLLNREVNFTAAPGDYLGLSFTMGVPFELNHQDSSTASSPLNLGAMQWNWQVGYKFIRLDLVSDSGAPFNYHIGSTGCASSAPTQAPQTECQRSNRMKVVLQGVDFSNIPVVELNLDALLSGTNVEVNSEGTAPGCMSGPTDPECPAIFEKMGLDLQTGACINDCAAQQLFRLVP